MGKIAPGLYIRDISEIREGRNSYHFKNYSPRPPEEDRLLSIIGTEKTISLELPSQVSTTCAFKYVHIMTHNL